MKSHTSTRNIQVISVRWPNRWSFIVLIQRCIVKSSWDIHYTNTKYSREFVMSLWFFTKVPKYWFINPFDPFLTKNFRSESGIGCCTWFWHSYRRSDDRCSIFWTLFRFPNKKKEIQKNKVKHTHKSSRYPSDYLQVAPNIWWWVELAIEQPQFLVVDPSWTIGCFTREDCTRSTHWRIRVFQNFFLSDHNFFGSPIFDRKKSDLVHTSDIGYPIKLGLHDGSVMRKCIMQISSAGEFEPASIGS